MQGLRRLDMGRKRKTTKTITTLIAIVIFFIAIPVLCQIFVLNYDGDQTLPEGKKLHEADYVNAYCNGTVEYILPDKTRVDCLTETHACEFDWANKWYEGFGQALWYAHNTGKEPCLVLILKSQKDYVYFNRAKILCDKYGIKLIEVKAKDFMTSAAVK